MLEICVVLNEKDIDKIYKLNSNGKTFSKKIYVNNNKENCCLGEIIISPEYVMASHNQIKDDYLKVSISLFNESNEPFIYNPSEIVYITCNKNIIRVLVGEHMLINTTTGERIKINVILADRE